MGYVYLIIQAVMFSFGGILIKLAGQTFSPFMTSFLRFAIGILFLRCLLLVRGRRACRLSLNRIIIFGGLMKALHYLGENYGVEKGFSYGNIVIWPVQTVVVLLVSVFVFHEKVKIKAIVGAVFCILGIGLISWNGAPTGSFMEGQGHLLPAFIAAGAGAALFSVCQKRLLGEMGTVEMNMSMFFIGGLAAACTIPPTGAPAESIRLSAVLAVLALGAITGLGFLLQAEAFRTVPVFTATIIQSSTVLLSLLWATLLWKETITVHIILGTALFLFGILLANLF